jgi:hypothetical protein
MAANRPYGGFYDFYSISLECFGYTFIGGQREMEEVTELSVAVHCKYSIIHVLSSFFPKNRLNQLKCEVF